LIHLWYQLASYTAAYRRTAVKETTMELPAVCEDVTWRSWKRCKAEATYGSNLWATDSRQPRVLVPRPKKQAVFVRKRLQEVDERVSISKQSTLSPNLWPITPVWNATSSSEDDIRYFDEVDVRYDDRMALSCHSKVLGSLPTPVASKRSGVRRGETSYQRPC